LKRQDIAMLILGEATHLDLPSTFRLEQVNIWSGKTCVIVFHDGAFLDRVRDLSTRPYDGATISPFLVESATQQFSRSLPSSVPTAPQPVAPAERYADAETFLGPGARAVCTVRYETSEFADTK